MKLAIIGAGGFRTPLVYRALLADHAPGRVDEVRLFDVDPHRQRVIIDVLRAQARGVADAPECVVTSSLAEAVRGADFVFSAIRVGGVAGRARDERIGLDHGVIGQETVGAGGISYALRTIPVALEMARVIAREAPEAWVINFTNPAGVITQAMATELGARVIGICDSPVGLARHAMTALGVRAQARPRLDYLGLNHLGWLRHVEVDGHDILPELFADSSALGSFEEGKLFGADWLRAIGSLPNEYLYYYYFTREQLRADQRADEPRGAYLAGQQDAFYSCFHGEVADPYQRWEEARRDREETHMATNREAAGGFTRAEEDLESGGYDRVALALMRAIARNEKVELILNVPNRGTIGQLADEDIIEVPCLVDADGPRQLAVAPLDLDQHALVCSVKAVERDEIEAVLTRSKTAAWRAFARHPLVDSAEVGRRLLNEYIEAFPHLDYLR